MKRFPHWQHRLTTAQQYWALQSSRLCRGRGTLRRERLQWEFETQPTPLGRAYQLRIVYRLGVRPEVYVDDPNLVALAEGRRLPHVYQQHPPRLCLYLPGTGEWTSGMRIVDTIVPWSMLWLFYFEDWLATNEWKGGGMHPGDEDAKANAAHAVE